ncbi:MAG: phosphatase PAP2 family protein [Gemmatimonadota bacterium]|jgi:membrane-associated phospholipid phosphatase|nr:phosphatase PAP2 family protein [Gemmatimonadota bacterium]MDQ8169380.1 phosphatase PAP2 family protein [Gemmatimonadota bacterium]MDQ8174295.1 phosphatase PAP2 family protein [Gemmatimonadota bacterium]
MTAPASSRALLAHRVETRDLWRALGITLVLFALAWVVDREVYQRFSLPTVYDKDWGRLLRIIGFLPTWIALAVGIALAEGTEHAVRPRAHRRGWLLFWGAAGSGIAAELLKLTLRRERPGPHDGLHVFRDFAERTFSSAGLALPSSHTMVAFGGAAMLARLYPRARWVGYTLAAGCGISRVLHRAHFLSDVVLAAGAGWLVVALIAKRWGSAA